MDRRLRSWALKQPEHIAIECGSRRHTYRELESRVEELAGELLRSGYKRGSRIGLMMPHGPEMVAAIIATIRAGMTFVPIDPLWPTSRSRAILSDVAPALVVIDKSLAERSSTFGFAPQLIWESRGDGRTELAVGAEASDVPAYILFTSGSTGRAKGVIQSRAATVAHAESYAASVSLSTADRLSALAPYTFDAALMDIFGAIAAGATLCIHDPRAGGLVNLAARLASNRVSVCHQTPTLFRAMLTGVREGVAWPTLRYVVLGGEPVYAADVELARRWLPREVKLINGYGPTECTMASQQMIDHDFEAWSEWVPIGTPVPGVEIALRRADGTAVVGEGTGEMILRSEHVALGYWPVRKAEQQAFGSDADGGIRTYATGDLAARLRDGRFVHLGRIDHQVKIGGHRVEPVEVEAHLTAVAGVRQGAVAVRDTSSGARLAAWFVPDRSDGPTAQQVRRALQSRLPTFMIPSTIISVPAMPLLPTGKIDRGTLLERIDAAPATQPLRAPFEDALADIWRRTLGLKDIDPDADFFALGGDSLQALTIQIEAGTAVGLPIPSLFSYPSIATMARHLRKMARPIAKARSDAPESAPLSPPQRRYWERIAGVGDDAAFHIGLVFEIEGHVDFAALASALAIVTGQNDALRIGIETRDDGPRQVAAQLSGPLLGLQQIPATATEHVGWQRAVDQLARRQMGRKFDMAVPGLLRANLLRGTSTSHALVLSFHHLILDAWGRSLLETALFREYGRQLTGLPPETDGRPSYLSSALDMLARAQSADVSHPLSRLLDQLSDPTIRLPYDDTAQASGTSSNLSWVLNESESDAIGRCARAFQVTPFAVIATLFNVALARWTGERTIVTTFDRANRYDRDWEVVGLFSDVAPLIVDADPARPFSSVLRSVHRGLSDAQSIDMPFFADMVEQRWPGGLRRYDEIFPIAIAMEENEGWCERPGHLTVRRREIGSGQLSRDLLLLATQNGGELMLSLVYRSHRLHRRTIARLMSALKAAHWQMALRPSADWLVSEAGPSTSCAVEANVSSDSVVGI